MLRRKFFGNVKKHVQRNVSADALCLHYCDAMKSHLASIKCKKPLGRPGLCPGPRWGSLQRSPRSPSWWGLGEGAGCPLPKNHTPAVGLLGISCLHALFSTPRTNILATALGQQTLTTPLSRKIFYRQGGILACQCTKFEVSRFTLRSYEWRCNMQKMGRLGAGV